MIERITKLLKNNDKVFAWNVREINTNSYQLFFIKQQLDMNREVNVSEYFVTVFIKEGSNNQLKMGQITFGINPTMTDKEIDNKINEQLELCKFTLNDAYELPKYVNLKPSNKEKGFNGKSIKEAAFIVADAIFEADKYDKGYINSTEIFINNIETHYVDSNENDFFYVSQEGQIEFVVTWAEKEEEIELYKLLNFNTLDTNFIQHAADSLLQEANSRIKAIKTPSLSNVKLVLQDELAKEYFFYFKDITSTDAIYNQSSSIKVLDNISNGSTRNDKLTITLEPILKGSTRNKTFDEEGTVLKKLSLINKDVVVNLWGSNAKSQYLDKNPNGLIPNLVVSSGSLKEEDLEDENYVEIVSVSDFYVDVITGDFGSEIRLGYLHTVDHKEKIAITGGSFSGNINDSIQTVRFSNEVVQVNNYLGPKKVLLEKVRFNKGD